MVNQVKQSMDLFVRVLAFLVSHPVSGRWSYDDARKALEAAVARLFDLAGAQVGGQELSRAELRSQKQQVRRLVDEHMRPIVTIAQAQIAPHSDERLPAALRMPRFPTSMVKVLARCDGMIEAARPFEAVFVAHGLPEDFLAQFAAARESLQRSLGGRAALIGQHVAARAGLAEEVRRGRRAVARLDAIIRAAHGNDRAVLTAWRAVKRLHKKPGVVGRIPGGEPGPAPVTPTTVAPAAVEPVLKVAA